MSNTFATPQKLFRYSKNTFRFVYDGEITLGQKVQFGTNQKGEILTALVEEILEQRPSMGTFTGTVPTSYKLALAIK